MCPTNWTSKDVCKLLGVQLEAGLESTGRLSVAFKLTNQAM